MRDMASYQNYLGKHFVDLMTSKDFALIMDGRTAYTKDKLIQDIGIGNFHAVRILARTMKDLKFTSIMELFQLTPAHLADIHGLGTTTLYCLLRFAEHKKLDIHKWYGEGITWDALKARAMRDSEAGEAKRAKRQKKSNLNKVVHAAGSRFLRKNQSAQRISA